MKTGDLVSRALSYIQYRLKATSEHGVHSPFVYNLVTRCIYREQQDSPDIIELRRKLLGDHSLIQVLDYGAGGADKNTYSLPVSRIARRTLKPRRYAALLARLVSYLQPTHFLELGTSLGVTTATIAAANPGLPITTLEGAPAVSEKASRCFRELGFTHITPLCGTFDELLPRILQEQGQAHMVYIDGNHRKEPTLRYFEMLAAHSAPDTVLIFDDIYWSPGMREAWHTIQAHPAVSLTIDLYSIGLVFFRKDRKEKEHFTIRF